MLENLNQIDWANIHHSHGSAEAFPKWIRDLLSPDKKIRNRATKNIWEYSNHQGSIYDVTPYVTPFIIELIHSETTPARKNLLRMLASFVYASDFVCASDEVHAQQQQRYLELYPWLTYSKILQDGRTIYDAILKTIPLFIELLDHQLNGIRIAAGEVLCSLRHEFDTIAPPVARRIRSEPDAKVKAALVKQFCWMLREYAVSPVTQRLQFVDLLSELIEGANLPDQFQAALTMAELKRHAMPESAIRVLTQTILHPASFSKYEECESLLDYEVEAAVAALAYLPTSQQLSILRELLKQVIDSDDAHTIAIALLERVFHDTYRHVSYMGEPKISDIRINYANLPDNYLEEYLDNSLYPFRVWKCEMEELEAERNRGRLYPTTAKLTDITQLTEIQHTILQEILATDAVWMRHSNLLEMYGLPAERNKARQFLQR